MLSSSSRLLSLSLLQVFSFFNIFINFKDFSDADQCRQFTPEKSFDGRRLINHVIRIVKVLTVSFCDKMCYMEPDCVSINLYKRVSGHWGYKCELNNVTHEKHEDDLEKKDEYLYHAAEVGVASFVSTHFRLRKKKKFSVRSFAIVALILMWLSIFLSLASSLLFFYSCSLSILLMFQRIKLFSLQSACVDNPCNNNVCVPLDSKVQGVRKVTPLISNRS